jgi:tetratricopeptide (TPR) repeat protein
MEQKGDVGECLNYYRRSLSIFERLAAADPADRSVLDELARAYETLGDGLGRTDAAAERLQSYAKALEIRQGMLAQTPADAKLRRSVGLSLLKVGGASVADGARAVEYLRRAAAMLEELSAEDPQNARARREVGFAYYQLGRALRESGDYAGALESRRKAFAIREEVAAQDPQNKQARFDLAVEYGELAESYTDTGAPGEALAQGQRSLEILKELSASDPANAVYLRNMGLCYERLAQALARSASDGRAPTALRVRQWAEARARYQKALEVFSDLRERGALMPADAGQVEKFTGSISRCDDAIERLTARSL